MGVQFHPMEHMAWMSDASSADYDRARSHGYHVLRFMPVGVEVKFDDNDIVERTDFGLGPGVVLVKPDVQSWTFKTRRDSNVVREGLRRGARPASIPQEVSVARTQIRLFPEEVMTVQACRGCTFKEMLAHLAIPDSMSPDEYWLHLYVVLSRLCALKPEACILFDLPPRAFFSRGPPPFLKAAVERL